MSISKDARSHNDSSKATVPELELFFDNSLDIMILIGFDNRIKLVNPSFQRTLGWKKEEVISKRFQDFLHPNDIEGSLREAKAHESGSNALRFENRYRCKDGSYRWISWNSHPLPEKHIVVGIGRDITENKKAEEALKQSEERYRLIVDTAEEGIWVAIPDGKTTFVNKKMADMLGYSAEEVLGKSGLDFLDNVQAKEVFKNRATLSRKAKVRTECKFIKKDGSILWTIANTAPVFDDQGKHIANVAMHMDNTEHKKAEEELRKSEARFHLIAQAGRIGFFEYNASKDTAYWSPEHYEILGYTPGSVVSWQRWLQGIHPEDRERVMENAAQLMKRGRSEGHIRGHKDEYRFIRPDGAVVWIESVLSLDMIDNEAILRGSIYDITERKEAEEKLARSNQRIAEVLESIQDNFYSLDRHWNFVYVNKQAATQLGKNPKDLIGQNIWKIFPKARATLFEENYREAMDKREIRRFETHGKYVDAWVMVTVFPSLDGISVWLVDITQRKKAEESVMKAKEQYDLLFNSVTEGFAHYKAVCDENGKLNDILVLDINPAGALQSGVSREEQIGKTWRQVWAEIPESVFDIYNQVKQTKAPYTFEHFSPITHRWYLTNLTLIAEDQFAVTFFDITDLKKTEEALKQSQELISKQLEEIKSYYDNAPVGLAVLDRELRYIRVNNRLAEINGISAEQHIGKTVREVVPSVAEQAEELPRKIIRSGEAVRNIELIGETAACPDEKRTWLESWIPIKDAFGKVTALYVMADDITERKKAEETLKENEQLYHTVFDNSQDGFQLIELVYDKHGKPIDHKFLKVNHAYEEIIGVKAEEILDKTAKYISPNQELHWLEVPDRVAKTGISEHVELYNKDIDKWLDCFYFPYSKNVVGTLFRDITGRKKMEKQLQDSERLAAIGATAGMVGHDIRNPLQAITGDLFLAKSELSELPENGNKNNALESLDEIQNNVDYINKIVADLQDFARPLNPRAQETDITSIFNEMLKIGIPENVKVTVNVEDKARHIMADPDFLKRIVGNLTLNAVQAMPDGGELAVRAYLDGQTNDILITVKDTGVGIPEDVKPKLFTPMMTTKSKGQGFGLAVVKRMAEGLGGTVCFESEEGKGTTFIVRFPPKR